MKYSNLKELSYGFKSGALNDYVLCLDNDESFLRYTGPGDDGEIEDKQDEAAEWFKGNGYYDLKEALNALGVECEWV